MEITATYGVDLAARAEKTAVCLIEWNGAGRGRVDCPGDGAADFDILAQIASEAVTIAGIDAPFG